MKHIAPVAVLCIAILRCAAQPNPLDSSWIHEAKRVQERLSKGSDHSKAAFLQEGSDAATSKIMRELSSVKRALAHEMRGHSAELRREDQLLDKAEVLATRAGRYHTAQRKHEGSLRKIEEEMRRSFRGRRSKGLSMAASMQKRQQTASHFGEAASVAAVSRMMQHEAAELAKGGQAILGETRDIKEAVVEAIGEEDPRTAAHVEKLMDKVGQQERAVMRTDQDMFGRGLRNLHADPRKTGFVQKRNAAFQAKKLSAELAEASRSQRRVLHSDTELLRAEHSATGKIARQLSSIDNGAALEVEHLMNQAMREQRRVVRLDLRDEKIDRRLEAQNHRSSRRTQRASMMQSSSANAAAARLSRYGHALAHDASRKRAIAQRERRIVGETGAAGLAVKKALRGTRVGAEVTELLDEARRAARESEVATRQGVAEDRSEMRSILKLAKRMLPGH